MSFLDPEPAVKFEEKAIEFETVDRTYCLNPECLSFTATLHTVTYASRKLVLLARLLLIIVTALRISFWPDSSPMLTRRMGGVATTA